MIAKYFLDKLTAICSNRVKSINLILKLSFVWSKINFILKPGLSICTWKCNQENGNPQFIAVQIDTEMESQFLLPIIKDLMER